MGKILITGGAGFIGSHLATRLLSAGHELTILDNFLPQVHGNHGVLNKQLKNKNVKLIRGSVTSCDDVSLALEGVQKVVHLASETGTGQSMHAITHHNNVNTLGTAVLLEQIIKNKIKIDKFILGSSRAVYGEGPYVCDTCGPRNRVVPLVRRRIHLENQVWDHKCSSCDVLLKSVSVRENDYIRPVSVYGASKYAQEELVRIICSVNDISFGIFRMQNVYGEGQSLINPYTGILSIFTKKILNSVPIPIFEDGQMLRDFIYVEDVVNAFQQGLDLDTTDFTLNLGSGTTVSVLELVILLKKLLNSDNQCEFNGEYRLGDIRHCHADLKLLTKTLDIKPNVKLESGLSKFTKWAINETKIFA